MIMEKTYEEQLPCHDCDKRESSCKGTCENFENVIKKMGVETKSKEGELPEIKDKKTGEFDHQKAMDYVWKKGEDGTRVDMSEILKISNPREEIQNYIDKVFSTYKPEKKVWFEDFVDCNMIARIAKTAGVSRQRVHQVVGPVIEKILRLLSPEGKEGKTIMTPRKFKVNLYAQGN